MSKPATTTTSYDEVPYESHPFPQTHPDHLFVVAKLLGLSPVNVEKCRVLELGCAAGGNLLPMAQVLPASEFFGVDASSVEIDQGLKLCAEVGFSNVKMECKDIKDLDQRLGVFDYVICHGVYSWVPSDIQDKILSICKENLSPHGIAYISYNTYPGWHMRGMIRDMLNYHTRQYGEAKIRVRQARNFLDFLNKAASRDGTPYSVVLRSELETFQRSSDSYLFHEHLEETNDPIYFHQFVEKTAAKGLRYLAETDLRVMVPGNYPPEIANVVQMLAHDNIHMEQYLDFVRNTTFRQSLLCHEDSTPNLNLQSDVVEQFHLSAPVHCKIDKPDLKASDPLPFEGRNGVRLDARDTVVKAAMLHLSQIWPATTTLSQLFDAVQDHLARNADKGKERKSLAQTILNCYVSAGPALMELHSIEAPFTTKVSEAPIVSPLARHQAVSSERVTNLRHEMVTLGKEERAFLQTLDGDHTVANDDDGAQTKLRAFARHALLMR